MSANGAEVYANEASTTLAAATTATATSLSVASSASFPAIGAGPNYFMARLEPATPDGTREFVMVTAVSGTTWTVVRAQEGSTGAAWGAGATVTGVVTAGTLGRMLQALNASITLSDLVNQKVASFHINDDSTDATTWPNRFEFLFKVAGGTEYRTAYFNEYGELRVAPAKGNTVPVRVFTRELPTGPAHTVNCIELMDDRTTRTVLFAVDSAGNVIAPNLPDRITVADTQPASPAVGDVWIDTSA